MVYRCIYRDDIKEGQQKVKGVELGRLVIGDHGALANKEVHKEAE